MQVRDEEIEGEKETPTKECAGAFALNRGIDDRTLGQPRPSAHWAGKGVSTMPARGAKLETAFSLARSPCSGRQASD